VAAADGHSPVPVRLFDLSIVHLSLLLVAIAVTALVPGDR
jgi:hypothetical protein